MANGASTRQRQLSGKLRYAHCRWISTGNARAAKQAAHAASTAQRAEDGFGRAFVAVSQAGT